MTDLSTVSLISASMDNMTNGAITTYSIRFTPNTPIFVGDKINLMFPNELTLP